MSLVIPKHENVASIISFDLEGKEFIYKDKLPRKVFYVESALANLGDLEAVFEKRTEPMEEEKVKQIFSQLTLSCMHLFKHGVSHRDIKPENIFLDENFNAKLGDFGMAKEFKYIKFHFKKNHFRIPFTYFEGFVQFPCT